MSRDALGRTPTVGSGKGILKGSTGRKNIHLPNMFWMGPHISLFSYSQHYDPPLQEHIFLLLSIHGEISSHNHSHLPALGNHFQSS